MKTGFSISLLLFSLLSGVGLLVFSLLTEMDMAPAAFALPAGLLLFSFWFKYPKAWIYSLVCLFYFYFQNSEDGASALDVIFGIVLQGSLFMWFLYRIFISEKPLFRSLFDYIFLVCYLFSMLNVITAVAHGTSFMVWLREWTIGVAILYYFPIREIFHEPKSFRNLLAVAGLVIIIQIAQNIADFMYATKHAEYAWQIVGRRSTPYAFLMTAFYFISFTVFQVERKKLLLLSALSMFCTVGVFLTYSRTAMFVWMLCVMLVMILSGRRQRIRLVNLGALVIAIPLAILPFAFGRLSGFIQNALVHRLESSGNGSRDPAVQARFYEYRTVWQLIERDPVGGYGLATVYNSYVPITKNSTYRSYIHNGYLSLVYRFGFPFAIVYYGVMFYGLFEAIALARSVKQQRLKALAIAAVCALFSMLVGSATDTVIYTRSSTIVLAFIYATIGVVRMNRYSSPEDEISLPAEPVHTPKLLPL